LQSGEIFERENRLLRRSDGTYRWHLSRALPLRNAQGKITLWVGTATEVHEQKILETTLQQTAHQLTEANRKLYLTNEQLSYTNIDLDNFIYTASHDLKSPILNIEGLLEVLMDYLSPADLQSGQVQQVLELINDSVERFKRTIADLTEITQLQRNTNVISAVNLAEVVEEVVLDLQPQINEADAQLNIDVTHCPTFTFSAKNLRSIVFNLLSNAIKYRSPERKPVVKISCREEATALVFTVEDNGLGMNLKEDTQLFSLFRRLHDHVEGSGIGLFMVKRMMDNAQGKIEVVSQIGEGSTFTLYFPKSAAE